MGNSCCGKSSVQLKGTIEQKLQLFEESYKTSSCSALEIDRLAHRFCKDLLNFPCKFSYFCAGLKIPPDSLLYQFFNFLIKSTHNLCSPSMISCIGILYGSGSFSEKTLILFENYDKKSLKYLRSSEINSMLEDLTKIAFMYSPEFALGKFEDEDNVKLREYKHDLLRIRKTVSCYFRNMIVETHPNRLDYDDFVRCFEMPDLLCILDCHEMRTKAIKIKKALVKTEKLINFAMQHPKQVSQDLLETLECIERNEKKSNSR